MDITTRRTRRPRTYAFLMAALFVVRGERFEAADPPESVPSSPVAASTTATGELTADAVVQAVLARNPTLEQMQAAQDAAAARYPQVTSLDDPMLGLTVAPLSFGRNDVDLGGRIEVSQKVPWCGKRQLRGQAALAEAGAAGHDLEDMRLQLAASARNAFADYYLAYRALAVNDEALRLLDDFRRDAEARYQTGQVPQQDVLQAEVELGRQRQRRLMLDRMRKVAAARINTLAHFPPDTPLASPPASLASAPLLVTVEVLRSQAAEHRPDLKALIARVAAEAATLALARTEYHPDIEVTAAYDSMMGNGPTRPVAAQVGVRMNLPVRTARRQAAIQEAEARLAERRAELAARIDEVDYQVQEAYEQAAESEKVVGLYETTILPTARAAVRSARSAYITGKTPFLSLIEAERGLIELENALHEATADGLRRQAALERAIGGP